MEVTDKTKQLFGVEFEVFGLFTDNQGYINKRYIEGTGEFLTLTGWCEDTPQGTVRGYCEGERVYIDGMKFLINENDNSVAFIDKTVFGDLKPISERKFKEFAFRNQILTDEIKEFFTPRRPEDMLVTRRGYTPTREVVKKNPIGFI